MNRHLETKVFDGEILSVEDTVTVLINRHPFSTLAVKHEVAVGHSLQELVDGLFPTHALQPLACYLIGDIGEDRIPPDMWASVRPKAGVTVVFRALAEGKLAKTLALVGLAVLALVTAVFLPVLIPGLTIFGLGAAASASLIAGGITIAGSLAIQAMFPTPTGRKEKAIAAANAAAANAAAAGSSSVLADEKGQAVYSVSGARNQALPFGTIPTVLGRHRISPPYAAEPFTEFIGQDQYLTLMFCVGYGPIGFNDVRIGETPIGNFQLANLEYYAGWPTDGHVSFYPGDYHQEDLSIKLNYGVYNVRTTEPDCDYISIDIQAPEGIYAFDPNTGTRSGIPMAFNIYYAATGSGGYNLLWSGQPFYYGINALRFGVSFNLPRGRWDILIIRTTADSADINTKDETFWTALRSVTWAPPVSFESPLAMIGMKIKATDQVSGVVDTLNLEAMGVSWAFNGYSWGKNYTSNPADLFRQVLQGVPNKMPVPDSRLDLDSIQAWWWFCANNGFTYNAVIGNVRSVYDVVAEICAAGRAVPTWKDGKWSVIWDNWDSPVVQHFTPRNSRDFKGERVYRKVPHGFRIKFINASHNYSQDEMIVYDDGYYAGNATLFEAIEFPGVTDPNLIYKHGRYHIAQARLRPETYSLTVDFEHLRCTRGDRVRVQHDVALIGQISGRVVSADADTRYVTLDETIAMEAGKQYGMRWRTPAGDSGFQGVIHREGEWTDAFFDSFGGVPSPGDLFMFGERDLETAVFRVFKIEHRNDFEAGLTLVDDAPEIIHADTGPIPEFNPHISQPVDPYSFPPKNLSAIEVIQGGGDSATAFVRFSWTPARAANIVSYEAQLYDTLHPDGGWYSTQVVQAPQLFVDFHNILLGNYSFRVRARFNNGTVSNWATLDSKDITAPHITSPLADVENVRSAYVDGVTEIRWDQITDFRPVQYEIRRGSSWEAALLMGTFAQPPFAAHGLGSYWIAAVTRPIAGVTIYSPNPTLLVIGGARLYNNVVATWDEKATGWGGLFTGTAGISGDAIRTGGSTPFLNEPDFLGIPSLFDSGGTGNGNYYMPDAHIIDAGYVVRASVTIDYDGTGDSTSEGTGTIEVFVLDDDGNNILDSEGNPIITIVDSGGVGVGRSFLDVGDFLATPDFLGAASARFVQVFPLIGVKNSIGDTWFWQRWQPGVYVGRYFIGAMVLKVLSPQVTAYALSMSFTVDVPDRIERYSNLPIGAGGSVIAFTPEGNTVSAPYHGGPSGAPTPNVQVTVLNAQTGDQVLVTGKTLAQCTIRIMNGGSGVARNCDIVVQGY